MSSLEDFIDELSHLCSKYKYKTKVDYLHLDNISQKIITFLSQHEYGGAQKSEIADHLGMKDSQERNQGLAVILQGIKQKGFIANVDDGYWFLRDEDPVLTEAYKNLHEIIAKRREGNAALTPHKQALMSHFELIIA